MCTLTFLPSTKEKIFTFSRDEQNSRKNAVPKFHQIKNKNIFFPKDERKGGTWIATDAELFVCLLNAKHRDEISKSYQNSRGNVVLDRFQYDHNDLFFENLIVNDTAPFTLIIFNKKEEILIEISWDGIEKTLRNLDLEHPKIWSSSTLYSINVAEMRVNWFQNFLNTTENKPDDIWEFHQKKHTENLEHNILMKRNDGRETTSISQLKFTNQVCSFRYLDLKNTTQKEEQWNIQDLQLH